MKKIYKFSIVPAIIIVLAISTLIYFENLSNQPLLPKDYEIDFTFYDIEDIKNGLDDKGILMSTPTAITDNTIDQYCVFFDHNDNKVSVKYCTTTVIFNSNNEQFGNINMGGSVNDGPIMALALVEENSILGSNRDDINTVFQTMIETLVCDCWEERSPGNFTTVQEWIDEATKQFSESDQTIPLKSTINGLDNKQIILEITAKDKTYLWTLVIIK